METKGNYGIQGEVRPECLCAQPDWVAPSTDEIRIMLGRANWSAEEFSRRIGVDSRTVRRWTLGEKTINYAPWCVLCAQAGEGNIWLNRRLEDSPNPEMLE